jgi:hypothetical protein
VVAVATNSTWQRGLRAATSIVLGTLVGAGVNVLTGAWSWTIAACVAIAVMAWAALEWWRAAREGGAGGEDETSGRIDIVQRVGRNHGRLTGVQGTTDAAHVTVRQEVDDVATGGEITGYTDGS